MKATTNGITASTVSESYPFKTTLSLFDVKKLLSCAEVCDVEKLIRRPEPKSCPLNNQETVASVQYRLFIRTEFLTILVLGEMDSLSFC